MPALTRRRDSEAHSESWKVFYGDVQAGMISLRTGNPSSTLPWQWSCGFYPGSAPGEVTVGTAATLQEARVAFETAWLIFLANRTQADFDEYRQHRVFT